MNDRQQQIFDRAEWFRHDRFGMFIHWGLYAIPARGEWVRSHEELPMEPYNSLIHEFNPVDYNPREWAKLCKKAGMRYAVLTAKHHDGFCLFDSKLTDFKSTNSPCKRDLVREFADAFRAEGLKVGLYYSLLDWHHPDYPSQGDEHHPLRNDKSAINGDFSRYLDYMHSQVRELMSNYGKIDLLWLDFSYGKLAGDAWRANELTRMVRELQPQILLNSRLESSGEEYGSLMTDTPTEASGDFTCPEMLIPASGLKTCSGKPVTWECCTTLNNSWGFTSNDLEYKTADMLVRKLVECVSKDGNLLLNVGPTAKGKIPAAQIELLTQIGAWLDINGESIYGCGAAPFPRPDWGRFTKKGRAIFVHLLEQPLGPICVQGLKGQAEKARKVADGSEVYITDSWITNQYPDDLFLSLDQGGVNTLMFPKTPDYVLSFDWKENNK